MWSSRISASASQAASDGSGAAEHARAQPPERRALGMVVEQPPAGDDERGGIVVELAQAVGRLGDQEPVVAAVAGDGPESFERLHPPNLPGVGVGRVVPARTGGERAVEPGEEVGATGEQLGPAAHLERAPCERVLGPQPPSCRAQAVSGSVTSTTSAGVAGVTGHRRHRRDRCAPGSGR